MKKIDLWWADLDALARSPVTASHTEHLPATETALCRRLLDSTDRRRCLATRIAVRTVLGICTGIPPASLSLARSATGRPLVAGSAGGVDFSVTHCGGLLAVALSRHGRVGVDVEYPSPRPRAMAMAQRFFSRQEYRALSGMLPEDRLRSFYELWTLKEACIKATGLGWEAVHFTPQNGCYCFAGNGDSRSLWHQTFHRDSGHCGALALMADGSGDAGQPVISHHRLAARHLDWTASAP